MINFKTWIFFYYKNKIQNRRVEAKLIKKNKLFFQN